MNMRTKQERKKELEHELERVTKMLRKDKDIKLLILFGSLARGDISAKSDIDMIIIKDTKKKFLDRLDEIYSILVHGQSEIVHSFKRGFGPLREGWCEDIEKGM